MITVTKDNMNRVLEDLRYRCENLKKFEIYRETIKVDDDMLDEVYNLIDYVMMDYSGEILEDSSYSANYIYITVDRTPDEAYNLSITYPEWDDLTIEEKEALTYAAGNYTRSEIRDHNITVMTTKDFKDYIKEYELYPIEHYSTMEWTDNVFNYKNTFYTVSEWR